MPGFQSWIFSFIRCVTYLLHWYPHEVLTKIKFTYICKVSIEHISNLKRLDATSIFSWIRACSDICHVTGTRNSNPVAGQVGADLVGFIADGLHVQRLRMVTASLVLHRQANGEQEKC